MSEATAAIENSAKADKRVSEWMGRSLVTQGYCLTPQASRQLRIGLRFPTGLCLGLVALALALQSPVLLLALAGIGTVAGLTPRHPFDLLWNQGVRHLLKAPPLPPNPLRRRHGFKIGTLWLLAIAVFFQAGMTTPALALGGVLIAACGLVTTANFCVPSFLLSLLDRPRAGSRCVDDSAQVTARRRMKCQATRL